VERAALCAYQSLEGDAEAEDDANPPPLALRALFFAFVWHVHYTQRGGAARYHQIAKALVVSDAQWLQVVADWEPAPRRVWKARRWRHAKAARALYTQLDAYMTRLASLYEWEGRAAQRPSHKLPADALQLRWHARDMMRHFADFGGGPRQGFHRRCGTKFIVHYLMTAFRRRLLGPAPGIAPDALRWVIGYSKVAA